jgi:hypothetical protein
LAALRHRREQPRPITCAGGIPISDGDEIVGAIGVSGGTVLIAGLARSRRADPDRSGRLVSPSYSGGK